MGESGSGKSTTAKMIARLVDSSSGQIFLNGQDITNLKGQKLRKIYRDIQMVFQSATGSFDPRQTLGEGIGEGLRNIGLSKKDVKQQVNLLLEQCGLSAEFADRYPHEVSGGQCQRAAIARALAVKPKILICDEATSALDVTVQEQIIALLKKLQKETGISYLFICHDIALVQMFCDRVIVMNEGKIVEEGTPDEVVMNPKCDYTKQLIEAVL